MKNLIPKLLFLIFLFPSICLSDSESTIGGKTAQAHIIQSGGVSVRPRPYLDFEGITCADTNGKSVCTVTGSATNVGIGTTGKPVIYTSSSTAGPSASMFEDSTGNVGVGTIAPTKTLSVVNSLDVAQSLAVNATGGTITTFGGQTIHTFTTNGTFTPSNSGNVTYLIVGGAASGGNGVGGGGGAGGYKPGTMAVTGGVAYAITVGTGGATQASGGSKGNAGNPSIFNGVQADGGGGGGTFNNPNGNNGGSGGGGGSNNGAGGTATAGQGHDGGTSTGGGSNGASGGGGAGTAGVASSSSNGANGGTGTTSSISGASVTYACGGGGGERDGASSGGTGGCSSAGNGGSSGGAGTAGTANTGSGGGGGGSSNGNGGAGGSGEVIISYSTAAATGSAYFTATGGNVGVGVTTPVTLFDVNGKFNVLAGGNVGIGTTTPQGALTIMSGNVGIGTVVPQTALSFFPSTVAAGGINFGSDINLYRFSAGNIGNESTLTNSSWRTRSGGGRNLTMSIADASTPTYKVIADGGSTNQITRFGNEYNGPVDFESNTKVAMTIDANQNVGIGTSTPVGGLSVMNGNVGIGTWIVDSGQLIVSTSAGNVGIGTIRPGVTLDVGGFIRSTSLTGSKCVQTDATGKLTSAAAACGSGGGGSAAGGLNAIQYNSPVGTFAGTENLLSFNGTNVGVGTTNGKAALELVTVGSGPIFQISANGADNGSYLRVPQSGNVGIGSQNPGAALDVGSNMRVTSGNNLIFSGDNKAYISGTAASSAALAFYTNNAEQMRIANGGNVGIGTTVVSSDIGLDGFLDVVGPNFGGIEMRKIGASKSFSLQAATSNFINMIGAATASNNKLSIRTTPLNSDTSTSNLVTVFQIEQPGNTGIGTNTTSNMLSVLGGAGFGAYVGNAAPSGGALFSGNVGIGTTLATTAALTVMSGNVGIGTWVPAGALQIIGSGNIGINTTNPQSQLSVGGNLSIGAAYSTLAAPANGGIFQGNVGIGTSTPQGAGLVVTNGNVGIGTWTPNDLLNVKGTATFTGGITTNASINMTSGDLNMANTTGIYYGARATLLSPADGIVEMTNHAINDFTRIDFGGTSSSFPALGRTGTGTYIGLADGTNGGSLGIGTTLVSTSALTVMDGNVGIGTWIPGALLQIAGSGNVGIGTVAPLTLLSVFGGNVGIGTFTSDNGPLQINSATNSPFLISSTGNVGIGTIKTTTAALSIMNGNVGIGTWIPSGTFIVKTSGTLGWSVKAAANQACNTTCNTSGCAFGEDTSVLGSFVDCTDATADRCVCTGP